MENISIIMPLFNAEKYLPEALQSVLCQTYKDFELICIDDCSDDSTKRMVTDFQRKDKRIRLLANTEHIGAGLSRNKGLREAKGEYVIFLDGDDIFDEKLLEVARESMEKNKVDLVFFELLHMSSETIYTKKIMKRSAKFIEDYCRIPFTLESLEPREVANWSGATCNKMYRRRFLIDHKIEFQDLPSCNDVYFSKMALYCARSIIWVDDRRILVYAREHSELSRISKDRDPMCVYYALEKLAWELKQRNMLGRLANFFYCTLVSDLFYALKREKEGERKKEFYDFLQKEGIPKCIAYGSEAYNKVDSYDRYMLDLFLMNTYESGWFNFQETYFQFYLKKNGQAVLGFLKDKLDRGRKIVLWGVGINGKSLLDYLDEHAVRIFAVTDMDQKKQGRMVNDYRVLNPNDIWEKADLVMATSKQVLWEIKERTDHLGIEQVDVLELLKINE